MTNIEQNKPLKKSPLSKEELAHFRQLLLEKRLELIGDVNSMESEALRKSRMDASGDLSSMPIHMADIGTDNYEQEFALGLMDSERKLLLEIHAAIERIDRGVYGICEGTGQAIPKARLEANPWARYCVQYAEMVEKGMIREGEKTFDEDDYEDEPDEDILDEDEDILDEDLDEELDEEEDLEDDDLLVEEEFDEEDDDIEEESEDEEDEEDDEDSEPFDDEEEIEEDDFFSYGDDEDR